MKQIKAPWTPKQVKVLERQQSLPGLHHYTCPTNSTDLIPTTNGWICPCCSYTQDWAHDFMFEDI